MATKALITPELYLATRFEREPELVYGELVEPPCQTSRAEISNCSWAPV